MDISARTFGNQFRAETNVKDIETHSANYYNTNPAKNLLEVFVFTISGSSHMMGEEFMKTPEFASRVMQLGKLNETVYRMLTEPGPANHRLVSNHNVDENTHVRVIVEQLNGGGVEVTIGNDPYLIDDMTFKKMIGILQTQTVGHDFSTPVVHNYALPATDSIPVPGNAPAPGSALKLADEQWNIIGEAVLYANAHPTAHLFGCGRSDMTDPIENAIYVNFYSGIYGQASSGVQYLDSPDGQVKWNSLIDRDQEQSGYGKVSVAAPDSRWDIPSQVYKIYTGHEAFQKAVPKGRLQFVVTSGAGAQLFNDLEVAVEKFIKEQCGGNVKKSPVTGFKVLSENLQRGRSDSAIFYMSEKPDHQLVRKFVLNYLNPAVKDRLANLDLIGLHPISPTHIHGITYPDADESKKIFGEEASTSTGGLMSQVLTAAYKEALTALKKFEDDNGKIVDEPGKVRKLNEFAQNYVHNILKTLNL